MEPCPENSVRNLINRAQNELWLFGEMVAAAVEAVEVAEPVVLPASY